MSLERSQETRRKKQEREGNVEEGEEEVEVKWNYQLRQPRPEEHHQELNDYIIEGKQGQVIANNGASLIKNLWMNVF